MLQPEEQRVLGLKYKSKRIKDLTPDELLLHTKGLALKICVITGWQLPDSMEYVNILDEQLRKFLVDEFMNLNIDEIEYAMRNYGTNIQDWGKSMNLALIRQGLDAYLSKRTELSKIEEQAAESPKKPQEIDPGPVDWSDTWNKLKNGEIKGSLLDLIPFAAIYDWLVSTDQLKPKNVQKWHWMRQACAQEINRLSILKEGLMATPDDRAMLERLKVIKWEERRFPDMCQGVQHLIAPSKTIAVKELLTKNDIKHENFD